MAFLFGCEQVSLDFPTKTVFSNLSLGVDDGACIGIVGRNGDGKSTLLNLFDGTIEPDSGRVLVSHGTRFAHLAQADTLDENASVRKNIVGDMPEYEWAGDARIRSILQGLLFDVDVEADIASLSGGQRRRVDLARVLIADANVVLLDEPTNHLDMPTIAWLAKFLQNRFGIDDGTHTPSKNSRGNTRSTGALLVVTHDRWFLDEVCTSMWEVHDGCVEPFEGGYSAYIEQRVERDRLIEQAEQKRRNIARRELAWLSRGARARATKPKFHVEAARALIEQEPPIRNSVELKRAAISRLGKQCVTVDNVTFAYPDKKTSVLQDITWPIGSGDRFALLGANGAGKSTLLEIVQGKLIPQQGSVKIGKTVKFAFLSQRLEELEELRNDRVREVLSRYQSRYVVDGKVASPAQLLEQLGFEKAYLSAPVHTLSGGQKRRLQLMLILLDAPNVLILDEPSNDMDTDMLVAMENVLDTWPGTLIVVSHDRYLIERVTDDQYALINGHLRHVPRGVDEYFELLEQSNTPAYAHSVTQRLQSTFEGGASLDSSASNKGASTGDEGNVCLNQQGSKLSSGKAHELRKKLASLERKMNTLDTKIEQAKQEQTTLDPSDYVALTQQQEHINELIQNKEALEEEWLEISLQLEE